jgi:hypothetical protein
MSKYTQFAPLYPDKEEEERVNALLVKAYQDLGMYDVARGQMEGPERGRMQRLLNAPGEGIMWEKAIDPITFRPKDEIIANKGNYWADLLVAHWKGNQLPNYMDYMPRTAVQDTPNMTFTPMREESTDAQGNSIDPATVPPPPPGQHRVTNTEYARRKQAAAGPEPNPYSVVRGSDVNVMGGQAETPGPEGEGGDEQALQEILSQDEYNPDSGMTYQEWLEWKMTNSRSLEALGKITGARMPRMGQRR